MNYIFPELQKSTLVYKGRRFWIIEIAGEDSFGGINGNDADYAFYDAQYQAIYGNGFYAKITRTHAGDFMVTPTTTHVDLSFAVGSLSELVKKLPREMEKYLKACFG